MVTTVLYSAPALIAIALGLPLLLTPVRLLSLVGCAFMGALALVHEPMELDIPYQPYSHIFNGIPSEAEVCLCTTTSLCLLRLPSVTDTLLPPGCAMEKGVAVRTRLWKNARPVSLRSLAVSRRPTEARTRTQTSGLCQNCSRHLNKEVSATSCMIWQVDLFMILCTGQGVHGVHAFSHTPIAAASDTQHHACIKTVSHVG